MKLLHKTIQTVWIYLLAIKMDLFFFLPGGGMFSQLLNE
ncbi:putative membrane protein [Escherichia coli 97.0003]|uniref:Uncharacterized protein n=1 Tax=Escherichia coli EC1870 TaxID=1005554 RepID=A0AAV3HCE3_ECOLX|nr:hypothetical protein ECH7EC508_2185 [Escherichia coli O157:H7 str. EC508]EDZ76619.1 hypothetical protein ECH7EC4206_A5390 [Escherichia coli O157:H7 str. EC4206]EIN28927.1 hypothetical protein ECFDA505_1235 [Escherichia coli FDA505]EIN47186.1 hypothetical protein ECFRIK1990_1339 [Escherichia coli FRIK1990]EIN47693.1 hypothetical protein ECFRIK1985_1321 [Escherichia coli FRIK1985]EIN64592.1 hypothetical protein ECPA9_1382 [Escherichia coli PA9]EIN64731.1 hypothetical protein ECPA5_1205 [Esch